MVKNTFSENIVHWYRKNKRDLSFRKSNDPYSIWVSEIMAQQTKIDTMIPYYNRWMEMFPDIKTLSIAPLDQLLKAWEGLGYYRRVRMMHEASKYIMDNYNGKFPSNIDDIKKIKGIGDYTAAAIASIAFEVKEPAVDGNVLRVMTRYLADESDISKIKTKKAIKNQLYELMGDSSFGDFTQGLMELGALVCTVKKPKCQVCPLKNDCLSYKDNIQEQFPINLSEKKVESINLNVYIIQKDKRILISRDWSDGLMEGYVRLPQKEDGLDHLFYDIKFLTNARHIYSHRIWNMIVYTGLAKDHLADFPKEYFWEEISRVQQLAWISAHRKLIEKYILI